VTAVCSPSSFVRTAIKISQVEHAKIASWAAMFYLATDDGRLADSFFLLSTIGAPLTGGCFGKL